MKSPEETLDDTVTKNSKLQPESVPRTVAIQAMRKYGKECREDERAKILREYKSEE